MNKSIPNTTAHLKVMKALLHFCTKKYRRRHIISSRKHFRTKVTPDLHLTYSKNGGNLGLVLNDKKWKFLHTIICCGFLLESPRGGDSNR